MSYCQPYMDFTIEPKAKRRLFSNAEKNLLKELVQQHSHILESKKSDFVTLTQKKKAWESVTEKFNSRTETTERTSSGQLKKLWENVKFRKKAKLRTVKREVVGSGSQAHADSEEELDSLLCANYYAEIQHEVDSDATNDITSPIGRVLNLGKKQANCKQKIGSVEEAAVRVERTRFLLAAEKEAHRKRMDEIDLRRDLLRLQVEAARNREAFLEEKRRLQILVLKKQLNVE